MSTDLEQRLRRAFQDRATNTRYALDIDRPRTHEASPRARLPHRWIQPTLAAAAVLLVAAALVIVPRVTSRTPSAAAPDVPLVITDPAAIDLDGLAASGPVVAGPTPRPYVLVDTAALPPGWTANTARQAPLLDMSGDTSPQRDQYRSQIRLTTDRGAIYDLVLQRSPSPLATRGASSDPVLDDDGGLTWDAGDGVSARLWAADATSARHLQEIADQVPLVESDTLAIVPVPTTNAAQAPDNVDFQGTINGVRWWATIGCCSLRAISVGSATPEGGGAISNDRLSQPTNSPATSITGTITGIPGAGAVIAGYAAPDATAVYLRSGQDTIAVLPVVHAHGAAFFAVPIPDGVHADALVVAGTRMEDSRFDIPPLPTDFAGGYGFGG